FGSSVSDAATTATVPATVTASGETRHRTSSRASGPNTVLEKPRPRLPRTIGALLSPGWPRRGELLAGVAQQLRQRLGARDDRQEVRVAVPPRHDVQVRVAGDAGARALAGVHAGVEAGRPLGGPQHLDAGRDQLDRLGPLLGGH